jgi:phage gp36-like protein
MAYAVQQDIADLYGDELLYQVADRDRNQVLDTAAITKALAQATSQIDSFLSARYPVPLSTITEDIKRLTVDIAIYRLAFGGDAYTKEIRTRYEDALAQLKLMASGGAGLGLPPATEPAAGDVKGGEILTSGNERIFTRCTQRGL